MDLAALEGSRSPVRVLRLAGLDAEAGAQVLAEKDVVGSPHDRVRLVEVYGGNPLALKIVAQTIVELFGGEVVPFLEQGAGAAGRATRPSLSARAERVLLVGHPARAGEPGGTAGSPQRAEAAYAGARSPERAAPPQPDRAWATSRELYAPAGCDGTRRHHAHRTYR